MADLSCELGEATRLSLLLADGVTSKFPRATVYNGSAVPVAAVDLVHTGLGLYRASWSPPYAGLFNVVYRVFDDAGHTQLSDYEHSEDMVVASVPPDEPMFGASYDSDADELRFDVWVLRRGAQVVGVTSCEVRVYDADDSLMFTITDAAADGQGVFRLVRAAPGLIQNRNYSVGLRVTLPTHVVESRRGFKTVT